MRTHCLLVLPCLAVLLLTSGCSRSNRVKLGQVRGTVSFQGKPLAAGSLVFEVPGARQAQGKIANGKITEAGTYAADDGVPFGAARIAVFAVEASKAAPMKKPTNPAEAFSSRMDPGAGVGKSLIPAKYNDPSTSGLTWKIESAENEIALNLQ